MDRSAALQPAMVSQRAGARGFDCYVDGGADVDPARANSHAGHYPTVGIRSRSGSSGLPGVTPALSGVRCRLRAASGAAFRGPGVVPARRAWTASRGGLGGAGWLIYDHKRLAETVLPVGQRRGRSLPESHPPGSGVRIGALSICRSRMATCAQLPPRPRRGADKSNRKRGGWHP
jgi:hypothetical protein